MVGSSPYAVGSPSCSSYGMYPSSRYSGLCLNNGGSQPVHSPQNNIITQNTYTFKSERINPVVYQTYRKSNYNSFIQPQPQPQVANAAQAYQQALQTYQKTHSQQAYQRALQLYSQAYSAPTPIVSAKYYKPVQVVKTVTTPAYSNYNWSHFFRNGFTYKKK